MIRHLSITNHIDSEHFYFANANLTTNIKRDVVLTTSFNFTSSLLSIPTLIDLPSFFIIIVVVASLYLDSD